MSPPQQQQQNGRQTTTTSNTRRVLPARPLRPPPLGSRKNSHSGPSKKSPIGNKPSGAFGKASHKKELAGDADEEDMAGLPQFCATCEKQILTPAGISILYCSESCRRKDTNKPLSHSILPTELSPQPITPRSSYFGDDEILPMRSPTVVRPPSLAFSDSSDSSSTHETHPSYRHSASEASGPTHYRHNSTEQGSRRSSYDHFSTPSLSHTPASFMSTAGSYLSNRPLQRRSNPYSASFSSLSVDLVTPVVNVEPLTGNSNLRHQSASLRSSASTSTAFRVAEGEMSYGKNSYMTEPSPSTGSFKQLFSHEAMQASPRASYHLPASQNWDENREHSETSVF